MAFRKLGLGAVSKSARKPLSHLLARSSASNDDRRTRHLHIGWPQEDGSRGIGTSPPRRHGVQVIGTLHPSALAPFRPCLIAEAKAGTVFSADVDARYHFARRFHCHEQEEPGDRTPTLCRLRTPNTRQSWVAAFSSSRPFGGTQINGQNGCNLGGLSRVSCLRPIMSVCSERAGQLVDI